MKKTIKHNNILRFKEWQEIVDKCKKKTFECRGCTMRGREIVWNSFLSGVSNFRDKELDNSYLTLEEEPSNLYDPNDIMVICRGEIFGMMGYVGKEFTREIKDILRNCKRYRLDVVDTNEVGNSSVRLVLTWEETGATAEIIGNIYDNPELLIDVELCGGTE